MSITALTYNTNPIYQKILKLDKMLTEANIPHTLDKLFDGWQIGYPVRVNTRGCVMDAIEHNGSYGLEIMGLLTPEEAEHDDVVGCLSPEEVFERIRKHYSGEWDDYIKSLPVPTSEDDPEETSTDAPMTPEEFTTKMREAYEYYYTKNDDEELVHITMDGIMCDLLRSLGYGEGIDIFNNTPMWYA